MTLVPSAAHARQGLEVIFRFAGAPVDAGEIGRHLVGIRYEPIDIAGLRADLRLPWKLCWNIAPSA